MRGGREGSACERRSDERIKIIIVIVVVKKKAVAVKKTGAW